MNRIDALFQKKSKPIISIYFPAGFPNLNDTLSTINALQENDIDMIEIGIPFSDPIADGEVIQKASSLALKNGMSLRLLFEQLKNVRPKIHIPLLLMGYLNPILKYGFENFCTDAKKIGIDGFIIPDLPFEIYQKQYQKIAEKRDIKMIMLITPETTPHRIRLIDQHTNGFIYMVSSAATTGMQENFYKQEQYFERTKNMNLKNPLIVGFGISNKATYDTAIKYASGVIVGSKFVTLLEEKENIDQAIKTLKKLLQ